MVGRVCRRKRQWSMRSKDELINYALEEAYVMHFKRIHEVLVLEGNRDRFLEGLRKLNTTHIWLIEMFHERTGKGGST